MKTQNPMLKISAEILKYKHITPVHKLMLMIIDFHQVDGVFDCVLTSQDFGDILGLTRTEVQDEFWAMIELGLITSEVKSRVRHTRITTRTRKLIKC